MRLNLAIFSLITLTAACSPIEPVTDGFEPSYVERTDPFGFRIGVPTDLAEMDWRVDDPQRLTTPAPFAESFRRLQIDRVFTIAVDQPTGGLFLANHLGELVNHVRTTELVVYVYARIPDLTLEAFADSVSGIAYALEDERINGQTGKTLTYRGTQAPQVPRTNSEVFIPRHIFANDRFFYFIMYWTEDPAILTNVLRIRNTITIEGVVGQ